VVPGFELRNDRGQRQSLDLEQEQGVVQQIRRLPDDFLIGLGDRRQGQFQTFLADFLRDPARALGQQLGRIAAIRSAITRSSVPRNASLSPAACGAFAPQQVRVPVWQAGPAGFASTSRASPSQSTSIARTSRKLPELSPLVHRRRLLRLQKVTRLLESVAASASRFM
jgi:hypothetical protein